MARTCRSLPIVLPSRAVVLLLSLSLAPACNIDEVPPLPVVPPERAIYSPPSPACSVAFSPDEALRLYVEDAAARWSAATGCAIGIADGGTRVVLAESILRPDGSEAPGVTDEDESGAKTIRINRKSSARQRQSSTFHELGHGLGGDHTTSDGILSGSKVRRDVIDSAALDTVCSRLPCRLVSPEEP